MWVIGASLRLGGAALFVLSIEQAIRPRPLNVALLLAISVLLLVLAESVAPRQRS